VCGTRSSNLMIKLFMPLSVGVVRVD